MRAASYLLLGIALILLQGTVFRFTRGLFDATLFGFPLGNWLSGATPNLVLPLVVYLGIHETSMSRGALQAFGLGWALDLLGGGPAFLFRFTMVLIWWLARIASSRVSTQSTVMRLPLAFVSSLVESAVVLTLLTIFGADSRRPLELSSQVLPRAITTTLLAPLLFDLAHRISIDGAGSSGKFLSGRKATSPPGSGQGA